MENKVDLIIPVYNCFDFAITLINSILDSDISRVNKIIMIDDQSTEGNLSDLFHHDVIEVHRMPYKGYFSGTVNYGVSLSDAEYICIMNHDMKVLPEWKNWLTMCLEYYEKILNIGMVSPNLGPYHHPLDKGHMPTYEIYKDCAQIQFGAAFMKRSIWDEVGKLLDYGRYRVWHSDKEWLNRLTLKGYCVAYVPCWIAHAGGVSVHELIKVDPIREDEK